MFLSLIILTKQGGGEILTQIMPFIKPCRHESHHRSKLLVEVFIIVTNKANSKQVEDDKIKHVNGAE